MADKNSTYKVKANEFEFSFTDEQLKAVDLIKSSSGEFNLLNGHRSVNAKLIAQDIAGKKLTVELDGEVFVIEIKDELDQVLDNMGFGRAVGKNLKELKAPMPGLVLEVNVKHGQTVAEGDKILILEAMKMENSIMTSSNGIIKRIAVTVGQAVEKGQLLVELE